MRGVGALEKRGKVRSAERAVGGIDDADFTRARVATNGGGFEELDESQSVGTKRGEKTRDTDSDGGDFERAERSGKVAIGRYGARDEDVGENGMRTKSPSAGVENAKAVYHFRTIYD